MRRLWTENFRFSKSKTIADLPFQDLQAIGLTRAKTETIQTIARQIADGTLCFKKLASNPLVADEALRKIKGIGPWTAAYIRMRVLGDRDAFPANDLGVLKVLDFPETKRMKKLTDKWSPWRAYATLHLWNSLGWQTLFFLNFFGGYNVENDAKFTERRGCCPRR